MEIKGILVLSLFCAVSLSVLGQTRADSVVGTWLRDVESTDQTAGTKEIQHVQREMCADGGLVETVIYEECVTSPEGEEVTLFLRCRIKGSWELVNDGRDICIHYRTSTLQVVLIDIRFPLHAESLQNEMRAAFMKKNHRSMKNYTRTMQNILKSYYKRNDNSIFKDVSLTSSQMTAVLGDETLYFLRK